MIRFAKTILSAFGFEVRRLQTERVFGTNILDDVRQLAAGDPAHVVFDIGANEGQSTQVYLECFPQATIYSFEPYSVAFGRLREKHAGQQRVRPVNLALSAAAGYAELNLNHANMTNSLLKNSGEIDKLAPSEWVKSIGTERVATTTLADFAAGEGIEYIDFMKLDTQGTELDILKGGRNFLERKQVRFIQVEVEFMQLYEKQCMFADIDCFMREMGYYLHGLYNPYRHLQHPDLVMPLVWCDALYSAETKRLAAVA